MQERLIYNFVKQSFESEGYTLLSKEYIDSKSYLDYICTNDHKHRIKWNDWQQGVRCKFCSKYHVGLSYEFVDKNFISEGYQLLSKKYKNVQTYLNYICPKGHKHKIRWGDWQQGIRCPECKPKWSKSEKEILEYVKEKYNGVIKENDRTLIQNPKTGQYLELDIWLPELNKAIEYGAEYWHNDKCAKWRDNYKQQWCKENNIDLLVINDKEWRKNKNFNSIDIFIKGEKHESI